MASPNPPLPFGVSQFTTMPWTFDEDVARYAALGVDAIEAKLDDRRCETQMEGIAAAGLAISGVTAIWRR